MVEIIFSFRQLSNLESTTNTMKARISQDSRTSHAVNINQIVMYYVYVFSSHPMSYPLEVELDTWKENFGDITCGHNILPIK
jgi:hypothetical protein